MIDFDGLKRRFGGDIAQYLYIAVLLHKYDVVKHPGAYTQGFIKFNGATSITPTPSTSSIEIPILTSASIALCRTDPITTSFQALVPITTVNSTPPLDTVHSVPILLHHYPPQGRCSTLVNKEDTARPLMKIAQNAICTWVCLDNVLGSFLSWNKYDNYGLIEWNIVNVFTSVEK